MRDNAHLPLQAGEVLWSGERPPSPLLTHVAAFAAGFAAALILAFALIAANGG